MIVLNYALRADIIAAITATAGPLDGATLSVFPYSSPLTPGTRLVRADVLAAASAFTGSAAKTPITWGTAYRDGSDNYYRDGGLLEWICTAAPLTPESVFGVAWDDGATASIDPFATPVVIEKISDAIRYLMTFPYGQ